MNKSKSILIVAGLVLVIASPVLAHKGATGIVLQRMQAMIVLKEAVARIGEMLRGKVEFEGQVAFAQAKLIEKHAAEMVPLFIDSEQSRQKASKVKATLWDDMENFSNQAKALEAASLSLSKAILEVEGENLDRLRQPFAAVAKTCTGCHESYRQPEQ